MTVTLHLKVSQESPVEIVVIEDVNHKSLALIADREGSSVKFSFLDGKRNGTPYSVYFRYSDLLYFTSEG